MAVTEPSAALVLRLFGAFAARRDGAALSGLHLREGERILAYLILAGGEPIPSLELAKRFYPSEADMNLPGQGDFPCVRQALSSLRKALGEDAARLTRTTRAAVAFDVSGLECDVMRFDRLVQSEGEGAVKDWEAAVALYTAPLLEGWSENWVKEHRTRRKRSCERILRRLVQHAEQHNDIQSAEQWLRKLIESCPDDENARGDLLRLMASSPKSPIVMPSGAVVSSSPPDAAQANALPPEPAGGAMSPQSAFYVEREADALFHAALARRDGIVLVKGARQAGKTSLLARGLQGVRETRARIVLTDFQKFNEAQLASPDALCLALATSLALQLDIEISPHSVWNPDYGANLNLEQFVRRRVLQQIGVPLIWGLDEVDRLFACPFSGEIFGLFRSWYNERSLDPLGPWGNVTLAMAYATEAHLFIRDLNQSPFNVGTLLTLQDFSLEQVADLNRRHGGLLSDADLSRFYDLLGGQPFLVRHGFNALVPHPQQYPQFEADAAAESGIYGDHLRRMFVALSRSPDLVDVVRALLDSRSLPQPEEFFRLRAAGVLSGASSQQARFRCRLYANYLALRLAA